MSTTGTTGGSLWSVGSPLQQPHTPQGGPLPAETTVKVYSMWNSTYLECWVHRDLSVYMFMIRSLLIPVQTLHEVLQILKLASELRRGRKFHHGEVQFRRCACLVSECEEVVLSKGVYSSSTNTSVYKKTHRVIQERLYDWLYKGNTNLLTKNVKRS